MKVQLNGCSLSNGNHIEFNALKNLKKTFIVVISFLSCINMQAEDGYKLWLRYAPITDPGQREFVEGILDQVLLGGTNSTYLAIRNELSRASKAMVDTPCLFLDQIPDREGLVIGTPASSIILENEDLLNKLKSLGEEGYFIGYVPFETTRHLVVAGNTAVGALYGTFHLLRSLQEPDKLADLPIMEKPAFNHRLLNHWDNLDRTVERGYAGFSIWNWHLLPHYIDPRYIDYARANASIGINGSVVTNVNANSFALTPYYLGKVARLADVFRPYGIKIYLTARFSSPIELGGLPTADPLNPDVRKWWKEKVDEIYAAIPDFGGFLVKANSEGQPGPQNYGRTHADGANMLAEALSPHGGIVMWRAFVYSHEIDEDRAKQAYNEFVPLDGEFLDNVQIQVKNGAIDFQPREPFHPLFGSMPGTSLALELQITQEYLGQGSHLVYLAPLFKETLDADTYKPAKGSEVAGIISSMAGVSNIGTDRNWTGHPFGQANWFAFGRLAWDHDATSEDIAREWIRLTFGSDHGLVDTVAGMMMNSREAVVNYMTPLGLHHIMARGHHYGPGPWVTGGRPDWTSVYYHRADSAGIGFDRTVSGSNALEQYAPELRVRWADPATTPEKFLLWFHHLPWDYEMPSGHTLWEDLCLHYDRGVKEVRRMQVSWAAMEGKVDRERFRGVSSLLDIQVREAAWWKNACLLYFQQFSNRLFPDSIEPVEGDLEEFMERRFPYSPGIRPAW